ncbi:TIGR01777 family protein [Halieaceae bacterium IMCC14734]|uniref:TIGR01777 family protein n=1 Tax=Candidatus Litorirhabdus singularis TaxID=2518993 RepID=A0ABT3TGZ3_9GAMM|nr:TIGR01777 family oxidoreductase [Candidatus Litorirhabdus singularis]MCX2981546.1 TIGR01777 family protein [Candidatus Litorirhabdus singularis]
MNILITGGTGFIGGALVESLAHQCAQVTVYTRDASHFDTDSISYITDLDSIADDARFDAFINLAGESLATGRWTDQRKQELISSRVDTTLALVELARRLQYKPSTVLSGSAIGYYGPQQDTELDEAAVANAQGFAQELCVRWEAAAAGFSELGIRLCLLRLGVVLARDGGAMEQLAKSLAFGVGTWLGSGRQWLSWVHRDDVIAAMSFLLAQPELAGVFNLTAPEPVSNRQFCDELCGQRRALLKLPVPGVIMTLALGEMADELLLNGQRVVPGRLQGAGFEFHYPNLREALPDLLGD